MTTPRKRPLYALGIETSCDETSAAVVKLDSGGDILDCDGSCCLGFDQRDGKAPLFESFKRLQYGLVFNGRGHDMSAVVLLSPRGQTQYRQIVTFGRTAGEDNLVGRRLHDGRNLFACLLNNTFGLRSIRMRAATGIADFLG